SCLKTIETLKSQYDQLHKDFKKSELMALAYKTGLESVEEKLGVYKANESTYLQDIKKGLGYNAVPPLYTGNFMPPTPDLSFTGLDEFVNKPVVENKKSDEEVSKVVRKSNDSPIIEDWVSDSEEEDVSQTKTEKKTVKHKHGSKSSIMKSGLVSVNTSRQVNAAHLKTTVNAARSMSHLSKTAHSTIKRHIHRNTTFKNSNINQWVNTIRGKDVNAARPKIVVNTARPKAVVNVV
ncbi:hypothetical protein Tco_1580563, partial [Tanacetum coccineum]